MKDVLLFDGMPRTGKTTITAMLAEKLRKQGHDVFLYSIRDKMPDYAKEHLGHFYAGCIEAFYGFADNIPENSIIICDRSPLTELVYGPLRAKTIGKEAGIYPMDLLAERIRQLNPRIFIMDNTYKDYIDRGAADKDKFVYSTEAFESLRTAFYGILDKFKPLDPIYVPPTTSLNDALEFCEHNFVPSSKPKIDLNNFMKIQARFNARIHDIPTLDSSTKHRLIHQYIQAANGELYELLRATKFKLHQPGPIYIDRANAVEELIDVFKYLLCIAELLEVSGEEFAQWFYHKSEIVDQRFTNYLNAQRIINASY